VYTNKKCAIRLTANWNSGHHSPAYYYAQRPNLIAMRGVILNVPEFTYGYTAEIKSSYLSV